MPTALRDEDSHRAASLAIAGFAITIFAGLVVVEGAFDQTLDLPIYYSAISFIGYLLAHAVQGYKLWHAVDQVGDAAMDTGALSLILALVSLLFSKSELTLPAGIIASAALAVWLVDHILRWYFAFKCHKDFTERLDSDGKKQPA